MSQLEQTEQTDLGNTEPNPKRKVRGQYKKDWIFTIFNSTLEQVDKILRPVSDKCIMGEEICPNTGTLHIQGYVEFKVRTRMVEKYSKKIFDGHFDVAKGDSEQNYCYCSKDDKFMKWGHFDVDYKIMREHLNEKQLAIADKYIVDEDPRFGREIHWYWESTGGWGKTLLATYMVDNMGACLVGGTKKDMLFGVSSMVQAKKMPRIIVIDIPRVNNGGVSYQGMEKIKDGMFFNEKYESGMCRVPRPHIVVFSNCPPKLGKMSLDRWRVFCLDENDHFEGNDYQLDSDDD